MHETRPAKITSPITTLNGGHLRTAPVALIVGAIGIGCRRWITQHGLSLNVDCDLSGFSAITACGLEGREVGRLSEWIPGLTTDQVQPLILNALADQFRLFWQESPGS